MRCLSVVVLAVVVLGSAACTSGPDGRLNKTDTSTGAGVLIGGLAGSQFGKGSGRIVGGVVGAAVGDGFASLPDRSGNDLEFLFSTDAAAVRRDPAFGDFIRKMGIETYWDRFGWPSACRREGTQINCH